jgi:hypothetical protein
MLLLILILNFNIDIDIMNNECYEILPVKILRERLKTEKRDEIDFDFILKNKSFVFKLKNKSIILLPNDLLNTSKGLLLKDISCLNYMVKQDYFPIVNPEIVIFEKHIENIKSINNKVNYYQSYLNKVLKLNIQMLDRPSLNSYFIEINKNKFAKTILNECFFALGILIGENLRIENEGRWILQKRYGQYNPYFIPCILYNDGRIIHLYDSFQGFFFSDFKELTSFFNFPSIKNPGMTYKTYIEVGLGDSFSILNN